MPLSEIVEIIFRAVIVIILVILSVYDIKNRGVPLAGIIIPAVLALMYLGFKCIYGINITEMTDGNQAAETAAQQIKNVMVTFAAGLLPGIFQILISLATRKAGVADGILLCIIGGTENYVCGMVTWAAGSLLTALLSIVLLCLRKVNRNTKIPFIPFLTAGYIFEITVFGV